MFNKTFKKSLIILVACLMLALVVFAACSSTDEFKPVATDGISGKTAEGNGGSAVKYGDYIYYVNGIQSSATADNSYNNTVRSGSIVRVLASKLDDIVALNDEDLSSSVKAERIAEAVKANVQLIVPCFYYSTNSTNTTLTGIYIFNDRLYITTPNQELTSGGQKKTNQLVLESYNLDGTDRKQHFTFVGDVWSTSTTGLEIMLSEVKGYVWATYVVDNDLHSVSVASGVDTVIVEDVSNAKFDKANDLIFFQDEDGQICQFNAGASEHHVLVEKVDTDASKLTYTISQISDGYVYYTQADSVNSTLDGLTLYYARYTGSEVKKGTVLNAVPSTYFGWGEKVIFVDYKTLGDTSAKTYTVWAAYDVNGDTEKYSLFEGGEEITIVKVENGKLFYTIDGVTYTRTLGAILGEPTFYAKDLSSSATSSWAEADVIGNYTFALATDSVTVTIYDTETKTNSTSTTITLTVDEE